MKYYGYDFAYRIVDDANSRLPEGEVEVTSASGVYSTMDDRAVFADLLTRGYDNVFASVCRLGKVRSEQVQAIAFVFVAARRLTERELLCIKSLDRIEG